MNLAFCPFPSPAEPLFRFHRIRSVPAAWRFASRRLEDEMRKTIRVLTALAAFGIASFALAGAQARLKGKVTDASGNPLDGATITVTTPNLRLFKVTVKSDKKGEYGTILNDGTIPYHLKFVKDGFVPMEVDKKVPVGDVGVVDAKLQSTTAAAAHAAAAAPAPPSPNDQAAQM